MHLQWPWTFRLPWSSTWNCQRQKGHSMRRIKTHTPQLCTGAWTRRDILLAPSNRMDTYQMEKDLANFDNSMAKKRAYHMASGNWNAFCPEPVLKYTRKLTISTGSIVPGGNNWSTRNEMILHHFSTCAVVFSIAFLYNILSRRTNSKRFMYSSTFCSFQTKIP